MNYQFVLHDNNQFSLCPIEAVAEKRKKNMVNEMLVNACKDGIVEKVIALIENDGADLHLADLITWLKFNPAGNSPLHIASAKGYNDIVEYLLSKGANIHSVNKRLASPLHSAVFKGRIETVKLLLDKGASIEAREDEGDTPIAWASYTGFAKIVEHLIERGADIQNKNNLNYTPLHWACYIGHLSVVKILIENGANINAINNFEETPIICASNCGRDDVYAYLFRVSSKKATLRLITE